MNITFFKRPKPRQFEYKPLYYDPEMEEFQERKKEKLGIHSNDPKERLRAEIRRRWRTDRSSPSRRDNTVRVMFYVIIAGAALYLIFFTDFVNKLVSVFLR